MRVTYLAMSRHVSSCFDVIMPTKCQPENIKRSGKVRRYFHPFATANQIANQKQAQRIGTRRARRVAVGLVIVAWRLTVKQGGAV